MKSPEKPSLRRDVERQFWCEIAKGLTSEDAALAVGASQAAGSRWFRERGGMPTFMTAGVGYKIRVVIGALLDRAAGDAGSPLAVCGDQLSDGADCLLRCGCAFEPEPD
jgi:hypothetical protein